MPAITKSEAEKIAKKLMARIVSGRRHDLAIIEYAGKWVCQFGLRRGKQSEGHDFIPGQIKVSRAQALQLARCSLSYEEWLDIARQKGLITEL